MGKIPHALLVIVIAMDLDEDNDCWPSSVKYQLPAKANTKKSKWIMKVSGITSGPLPITVRARDGDLGCVLIKAIHLGREALFSTQPRSPTHPCCSSALWLFSLCVFVRGAVPKTTRTTTATTIIKKQERSRANGTEECPLSWRCRRDRLNSMLHQGLRPDYAASRADEATFTFHTLRELSALYSQVCSNVTKHSSVV